MALYYMDKLPETVLALFLFSRFVYSGTRLNSEFKSIFRMLDYSTAKLFHWT